MSAPGSTPSEANTLFTRVLNFFRDHPTEAGLIHQQVRDLYHFFHALTAVDANLIDPTGAVDLPTGKAISAPGAARTLLEAQRTAVFLRSIEQAIRDLQQRFPAQRIRILYAGCGPFASLLTPLTARFTPQQVGFHLLEINPQAFAPVQHLFRTLALEPFLLATELVDATTFRVPPEAPFHLIVSETMQSALKNEPQLAIMLNLLPQLPPGAIFIPQRISISAEIFLPAGPSPEGLALTIPQRLGPVYEISAETPAPPAPSIPLQVPPLPHPEQLFLTTEIQVYQHETLSGNDTSITLPHNMRRQLHGGEHLTFHYQWQPRPGFTCNQT